MIRADALRPFEENPRTITAERRAALRASLAAHGVFKPLLVWGPDNLVIGGNQRLSVLSEMIADGAAPGGVEDGAVPCIRFEGDEPAARAVALRDNTSDGDWSEALPDYLADLRKDYGEEWSAALVGFDAGELDEMLAGFESDPPPSDPLAPAPLPVEPAAPVSAPAPAAAPSQSPAPTPEPADTYVGERFTKVGIGNIRGKIGNDLYGRFLGLFNAVSQRIGSTELSAVFRTLVEDLEAHASCVSPSEPKAPKKRARKEG